MRKLAILLLATLPLTAAEMSYIFKRGDRSHVVMGNMAFDGNISKLTSRWSGSYLWARIGSREYLIRDAGVLAEAAKAFVQVDANQVHYHALSEKMRPIEKRHRELEEQHDELADAVSDEPERFTAAERREAERRIRQLEEQMKPLEQQLRVLEKEEDRLDDKQEVLEEAAEKQLREIVERAIARGLAQKP